MTLFRWIKPTASKTGRTTWRSTEEIWSWREEGGFPLHSPADQGRDLPGGHQHDTHHGEVPNLFPADENADILERVQVGNIINYIFILILRIIIFSSLIWWSGHSQRGRKRHCGVILWKLVQYLHDECQGGGKLVQYFHDECQGGGKLVQYLHDECQGGVGRFLISWLL